MSYEGYDMILCKAGHLHKFDCYDSPMNHYPYDIEDTDSWKCGVMECHQPVAWWSSVDTTNGLDQDDEGNFMEEYPGQVNLEVEVPAETAICSMGHTHETRTATYKIPPKGLGHHL